MISRGWSPTTKEERYRATKERDSTVQRVIEEKARVIEEKARERRKKKIHFFLSLLPVCALILIGFVALIDWGEQNLQVSFSDQTLGAATSGDSLINTYISENERFKAELSELWPKCPIKRGSSTCSKNLDTPEKRKQGYCSEICRLNRELADRERRIESLQAETDSLNRHTVDLNAQIERLVSDGGEQEVEVAPSSTHSPVRVFDWALGLFLGFITILNIVFHFYQKKRIAALEAYAKAARQEEVEEKWDEEEEDDGLEDSRDELEEANLSELLKHAVQQIDLLTVAQAEPGCEHSHLHNDVVLIKSIVQRLAIKYLGGRIST